MIQLIKDGIYNDSVTIENAIFIPVGGTLGFNGYYLFERYIPGSYTMTEPIVIHGIIYKFYTLQSKHANKLITGGIVTNLEYKNPKEKNYRVLAEDEYISGGSAPTLVEGIPINMTRGNSSSLNLPVDIRCIKKKKSLYLLGSEENIFVTEEIYNYWLRSTMEHKGKQYSWYQLSNIPNDTMENMINTLIRKTCIWYAKGTNAIKSSRSLSTECMDFLKINGKYDFTFYISDSLIKHFGYTKEDLLRWIELINSLGFSQLKFESEVTLSHDTITQSLNYVNFWNFFGKQYKVVLNADNPYYNYVTIILLRYIWWNKFADLPRKIMDMGGDLWAAILKVNNRKSPHDWNISYYPAKQNITLDEYKKLVYNYNHNTKPFTDLLR